jgi:hypothetical protein
MQSIQSISGGILLSAASLIAPNVAARPPEYELSVREHSRWTPRSAQVIETDRLIDVTQKAMSQTLLDVAPLPHDIEMAKRFRGARYEFAQGMHFVIGASSRGPVRVGIIMDLDTPTVPGETPLQL